MNLLLSIRNAPPPPPHPSPPLPNSSVFPPIYPPTPPPPPPVSWSGESGLWGGGGGWRWCSGCRWSARPCSRLWIGPGAPAGTGRSRGGCWEKAPVVDSCLKPAARSHTGRKAAARGPMSKPFTSLFNLRPSVQSFSRSPSVLKTNLINGRLNVKLT